MVYNADFVPHSRRFPLTYICGEGFRNYVSNLTNVSHPAWKEVKTTIQDFKPSIVGIYCCSANLGCVSMVARLVKEYDGRVRVVVGGPHPTAVGAEMLDDANIDVSVVGEGERTIIDLLEATEHNKPFSEIKGIIYRDGSRVVKTQARECIDNLDSFCSPYEYVSQVLRDYEKYPKSAFGYVMATRGCKQNCLFCGSRYVFGRKVRYRSVGNVTEELRFLKKMGIRRISFLDDTFGSDKEYTQELCRSLIQNLRGLRWSCTTRADVVDGRTIALMKRAGCREIAIGIESGNNEMLRKMRKGITLQTALDAARTIRENGIKLIVFFMIGFPGETEKTLSDTFETIKKIDGTIIYNIFTPFPGTEGFDLCKQIGLIGNNYAACFFNHKSPENCFTDGISKERFRELASVMEKYVDFHNLKQNPGTIFDLDTLRRVHHYGLRETLRRAGW
jgi:radical SAM superfamily enzyme YgiQ (UPF0313 family)